MPRVLEDDHYKRMTRVTVDVALKLTLTALWPSIGQNLQPFTGKGDVSIGVKFSIGPITPKNKVTQVT